MSRQLLIGEFSKQTGISARMLRYFDKMELLVPHHIDDMTGYRYYSDDQIKIANKIIFLQSLGFSLSEIKNFMFESDKDKLLDVLLTQEAKLKTEKRKVNHQLLKIKEFIDRILFVESVSSIVEKDIERSLRIMNTEKNYKQSDFLVSTEIFKAELQNYLDQDYKGALIEIDIDFFARINQEYGYETGDLVTASLFNVLMEHIDEFYKLDEANLITRTGGDDFKIFIKDVSVETMAQAIGEALNTFKSLDFISYGIAAPQTFSAGIVSVNGYKHYSQLDSSVTKQLIAAKRGGRQSISTLSVNSK